MFLFIAPFNSSLLARGTALAESGSVKVQADAQSGKNARRKHFFPPPFSRFVWVCLDGGDAIG